MPPKKAQTLIDFLIQFPNEKACIKHFERIRFPKGLLCVHDGCGSRKVYRFKSGRRYRCAACKKDFSVKTGTIFGDSHVPLHKWFIAIYLLTTNKKGISSIQLAEKVGVTTKTAWFMDHRLREAMKQGDEKLFGTVETDETYVGGKEYNKHARNRIRNNGGRSNKTKIPLMGSLQRGENGAPSKLKVTILQGLKTHSFMDVVKSHVEPGSTLYTDTFMSYYKAAKLYAHATVDHGGGEYVRGDVHTNGIEGAWSIFKGMYRGTYHVMSKKHLKRYVDEFVYRFNNRELGHAALFNGMVEKVATTPALHYKDLIYDPTKEDTQAVKGRSKRGAKVGSEGG